MITLFKDPFFETLFDTPRMFGTPQTKITKTNEGYKVTISVPGLTKDDLKILVEDGTLKISYEGDEKNQFLSKFTKAYSLPDDVNVEKIDGKVKNGILELNLPFEEKRIFQKLISLN